MAKNNRGITLIVVILIILIIAIAALGIAVFVTNSLRETTMRAASLRALCAAQAGVYWAINQYITSNADSNLRYWNKARDRDIMNPAVEDSSASPRFDTGRDANFLLVDALNALFTQDPLAPLDFIVYRIPLKNINNSQSITVDRVMVEWSGQSGVFGGFTRITLGGVSRWNGSPISSSPAIINLSPSFTLAPGASSAGLKDNMLRFATSGGGPPGQLVMTVTFFFTDGSSRKALLLNGNGAGSPAGPNCNREFSITSTGEVIGATTFKRTIEATYDVRADRLTSWQEREQHVQ